MVRAAALILLAAQAAQPNENNTFYCLYDYRAICQGQQSCAPMADVTGYVLFDSDPGIYSRCADDAAESATCPRWPAIQSRSGAYLNVSIPQSAVLTRIADDGTFSEVVAHGHTYWISHGKCMRQLVFPPSANIPLP